MKTKAVKSETKTVEAKVRELLKEKNPAKSITRWVEARDTFVPKKRVVPVAGPSDTLDQAKDLLSEVFDHGVILVSWTESGDTLDNWRAFGSTHVTQALCKASEDMVFGEEDEEVEFGDDDEEEA
jgi:hypothetical protein